SELDRTVRFDVPVFRRREIIVSRTVPDLSLHIQPLPVGKPIGNQLAHPVIAATVRPDIHDDGTRAVELLDDLIYRSRALFDLVEPVEVKITDRIRQPSVYKNTVH